MLDALYYSSSGEISTPLKRYIQIDIDDIFVGAEGTRIGKDDVDEMIKFQEKWENNSLTSTLQCRGQCIHRKPNRKRTSLPSLKKSSFKNFGQT